jgi:LuxR family maltose regulon positive regulatory protein
MARIAVHRMNWELAHTLLERAENLGYTRGWGRLSAAAVLEQMRLSLHEGRIDEAVERLNRLERLAAQYPAPADCAWSDIHRYAALARAYAAAAQHRFDDAISILNGLQHDLETVHNRHFALRVEMLVAAIRFRTKQTSEALESFGRIVAAFAQAGICRTILDERTEIEPLLLAFQESAGPTGSALAFPAFVAELAAVWKSPPQSETRQSQNAPDGGALSRRESGILRLIGEGLSNKEIARELAIAPETVKSHIKHIFAKLNVERRAQAVSRAQNLGLVGTQRQ